ncbi:unnamed protein product [Prunus armeniaca]
MTMTANCDICGAPMENATHIAADLHTWVAKNLHNSTILAYGVEWSTMFAFTCWFLWKWRNKNIFDHGFVFPNNPRHVILMAAADWTHANIEKTIKPTHSLTALSWQYPNEGVIKINIDGCRKGEDGRIAAGGVLRDSSG